MDANDELAALRKFRDELARRHCGDARSLARELTERSRAAGRRTVRLPPRQPAPPKVPGTNPAM